MITVWLSGRFAVLTMIVLGQWCSQLKGLRDLRSTVHVESIDIISLMYVKECLTENRI